MRDTFQEQLQQDLHSNRPSPNASAHQAPDPCSTRQDTLPAQPLDHGPFSIVLGIPAWLESSRLPGKLIANINGKPMVRHVLDRCAKAESPTAIRLCTDSPALGEKASLWGFTAVMTNPHCSSGSDRLASVVSELIAAGGMTAAKTLIINVQGDQPFLDPALIDAIAASFIVRQPTPEVLTPIYRLSAEKLHNPNVVKVLLAADGRGL